MRLYYYRSREGNFGDDLNSWLWEELLPGRWSDEADTLFSGIGTIIGNPMPAARKVVIFSSGFGYSPVPADWGSDRWQVVAVRGPLTAKILDLPDSAVVADGALLLSKLTAFQPLAPAERSGVVLVPHHTVAGDPALREATDLAGVEFLDPRGECKSVIHRLQRAKLVLADSMHAAIIADVLRVPWVPVATSSCISSFKWLDWSSTLGVPYEPTQLTTPSHQAAFRSWAQRYYGQDHFISQPSEAATLAHVRRAAAGIEGSKRRNERVLNGIHRRLLRLPGANWLERADDRRRVDKLTRQLSGLSSTRGYLSDARRSAALADELHHRLLQLRS
jgi:succinoglycan biosynthesis protein ExoV